MDPHDPSRGSHRARMTPTASCTPHFWLSLGNSHVPHILQGYKNGIDKWLVHVGCMIAEGPVL